MNKFVPAFPNSWIIHEWSWMIVPVSYAAIWPLKDNNNNNYSGSTHDVILEPSFVIKDKAQDMLCWTDSWIIHDLRLLIQIHGALIRIHT